MKTYQMDMKLKFGGFVGFGFLYISQLTFI